MDQIYRDREEAGQKLCESLRHYEGRHDIVVAGLPRGGVPVAFPIARFLNAPLEVLVVRKLGVPLNPELAMGALAGTTVVRNEDVIRMLHIDEGTIERVLNEQRTAALLMEEHYREGRHAPSLEGKTVLLVDDGLATGASMRAAVLSAREQQARFVAVAVPVGAPDACDAIRSLADELICPLRPEFLDGVGAWYDDFSQTSDQEVRDLLRAAESFGSPPQERSTR
jgi:predicted phosphoribosyltransferase